MTFAHDDILAMLLEETTGLPSLSEALDQGLHTAFAAHPRPPKLCEWEGCTTLKPPGHGVRLCATHRVVARREAWRRAGKRYKAKRRARERKAHPRLCRACQAPDLRAAQARYCAACSTTKVRTERKTRLQKERRSHG